MHVNMHSMDYFCLDDTKDDDSTKQTWNNRKMCQKIEKKNHQLRQKTAEEYRI